MQEEEPETTGAPLFVFETARRHCVVSVPEYLRMLELLYI
jgi:hypothetical protein